MTPLITNTATVPAAFLPTALNENIRVVEVTKSLSSMYPIIGCELVEIVPVNPAYEFTMWCDEEGMLKGSPLNIRASVIAGRHIFGNVILTGGKEEIEAFRMDCPAEWFQAVEEASASVLMAHPELLRLILMGGKK
jgi:hypothetical protein